jgi:pseudouridine kinase
MSLVVIGPTVLDVRIDPGATLQPGPAVQGRIVTQPGGPSRNIAEGLARLGLDVTLLSAVGDDVGGEVLLRATARAGVDISRVRRVPGGHTYTYAALTLSEDLSDGPAEAITIDNSIVAQLDTAYLTECADVIRIARGLIVHAEAWDAFRAARPGLVLPENTPLILTLKRAEAEAARLALSDCNAVFLNRSEAEAVCNRPIPDRESAVGAARWLLESGPQLVVVTLGAEGLIAASGAGVYHVPACPVQVVNATGAGDAVVAGFVASWLRGDTVVQAARYAAAAAALAVVSGQVVPESLSPAAVFAVIERECLPAERIV